MLVTLQEVKLEMTASLLTAAAAAAALSHCSELAYSHL